MRDIISEAKSENHSLTEKVEIWSFGYKFGFLEADAIFDVRFLPNPYYDENLSCSTGKDSACSAFVLQNVEAQDFVAKLAALILALRASADVIRKPVIKIAVGCTGGRHRSVAVVEELARQLKYMTTPKSYLYIEVHHRDAAKWVLSKKIVLS
ncbi:MAG TPA: RNase adapter RapZ [Rectinema sp.]|nr:RNase adapter RapZ [Rectinema sp.]